MERSAATPRCRPVGLWPDEQTKSRVVDKLLEAAIAINDHRDVWPSWVVEFFLIQMDEKWLGEAISGRGWVLAMCQCDSDVCPGYRVARQEWLGKTENQRKIRGV